MQYIERYKKIFLIFALGLVCIFGIAEQLGLFSLDAQPKKTSAVPSRSISKKLAMSDSQEITVAVYLSGEVKHPGVYILSSKARIGDALSMSGGFTKHAAESYVNLASKIKDGQHIHFPSISELRVQSSKAVGTQAQNQDSSQASQDVSQSSGKVNINLANQSELESLSGVGPATATKILAYRVAHGKFSSLNDLKNIPGIGDKKVEAISGEAIAQ